MLKILLLGLGIVLAGCRNDSAEPIANRAEKTRLTAAYCLSAEGEKAFDNTKSCAMAACDQGDVPSCEIARQFATQHAPIARPKKLEGMDYNEAREVLLDMGWVPLTGPCEGIMGDDTCSRFPEIGNCSGTGLGFCDMHFERRDRCLTITTVGGPPDGEVDGEPAVRDVHFSRAPCRKDPNAPSD